TNTKLLLITTRDDNRKPAHSLIAVLTNLPWAQQLGSLAPRHHRQAGTAVERAERYLATTSGTGRARIEAEQLLQRHDRVLHRYDCLIADHFQVQDRLRSRDQDNGLQL
ncbi:MAG TPA: hypothetical protein VE197_10475, partial [Mycobacterium sp.]|nr:hypothetical protein [Mycobacterium sp.]